MSSNNYSCNTYTIYQPNPYLVDAHFFSSTSLSFQLIPSFLSLLGTGSIILSYVIIPKLKSHIIYSYLIHLAFLELISSVTAIAIDSLWIYNLDNENENNENIAGTIQIAIYSAIQFFTLLTSFIWTSFIAFNFLNLSMYKIPLKLNKWIKIIGYIIPLIIVGILFGSDYFPPYQVYLVFYTFLWICISLNIFVYLTAAFGIRRLFLSFKRKRTIRRLNDCLWYPIILIIAWIINTVISSSIILQCANNNSNWNEGSWDKIWIYGGGIFSRLQGFLNAWAYLRTPSIKMMVKEKFSPQENTLIPRISILEAYVDYIDDDNDDNDEIESSNKTYLHYPRVSDTINDIY